MDDWIKVSDFPPPINHEILISDGVNVGHARYRGGFYEVVAANTPVPEKKVIYWMPMIKGPEFE